MDADAGPVQVRRAVEALKRATGALIDLLKSPDGAVRAGAADALRGLDPPPVWDLIGALIKARDTGFRVEIIRVLGGLARGTGPTPRWPWPTSGRAAIRPSGRRSSRRSSPWGRRRWIDPDGRQGLISRTCGRSSPHSPGWSARRSAAPVRGRSTIPARSRRSRSTRKTGTAGSAVTGRSPR